LYEPPDKDGNEALIFVSERRRIKVKGTLFREFMREVLPQLDGRHTMAQIRASVSDTFASNEIDSAIELLVQQHLVKLELFERALDAEALESLAPQLNFFHEVGLPPESTQRRLEEATVSIIGVGGVGAQVAAGFAAAGVGRLRLIDCSVGLATDPYFNIMFAATDRGQSRANSVRRVIQSRWPQVSMAIHDRVISSDDEMLSCVSGSDLVISCTDSGESSLLYKLNRACMSARIPWTSCAVSGFEVVIGPTIRPHETACYLCYRMRSVTCAEDPESEFSLQQYLDHRKHDDSDRRENIVFAAGLAANLVALESLKVLIGSIPCPTLGAIIAVNTLDTTMSKHVVLRHPACPVCFPEEAVLEPSRAQAASRQ
jgi:bacteriocin biosynthesis cyclodehydratase domain-containing protein